ncbi:MAG: hypothetical protein R2744_06845 [Bacteroidales bacterium]
MMTKKRSGKIAGVKLLLGLPMLALLSCSSHAGEMKCRPTTRRTGEDST